MTPLHIFLLLTFCCVCFLLVVSVLLQTGKGGGMAGLGGGSSDTAFGAHTANVLQKFTLYSVIVFFFLVITLAHYSKRDGNKSSVMDNFVAPQAEAKTVPEADKTGTPAPAQGASATVTPNAVEAASATNASPALPSPLDLTSPVKEKSAEVLEKAKATADQAVQKTSSAIDQAVQKANATTDQAVQKTNAAVETATKRLGDLKLPAPKPAPEPAK